MYILSWTFQLYVTDDFNKLMSDPHYFLSESGAECVYLGTAAERYLFPYNFSEKEGITEISDGELEADGWIFSNTIELPWWAPEKIF